MKSYCVQFVLPVENPVDNVVKRRRKTSLLFELPINYPNCEQVGLAELMRVAKAPAELSTVPTPLNNKIAKK